MPLYTYKCPECGEVCTEFNTIAERHKGPKCENHSGFHPRMTLRITGTQIQAQILGAGTYSGYRCPITDEYVTSRKRRREIMKEHNLVEAGDSSPEQRQRKSRVLDATNGSMKRD